MTDLTADTVDLVRLERLARVASARTQRLWDMIQAAYTNVPFEWDNELNGIVQAQERQLTELRRRRQL